MAINLSIEHNSLDNAFNIRGLKTKKDTVNQTLKEFI